MGSVTGGHLEIKTSGRYTYEMGAALSKSTNPSDLALWRDWYRFTLDMAVAGAFSQRRHRAEDGADIHHDIAGPGWCVRLAGFVPRCARSTAAKPRLHVFLRYNFLYVLAAGGRPDKAALGDHSPAGYAQRARFYAISPEARLNFSRAIASYIVFLAENTGLAKPDRCPDARRRLKRYATLDEMLAEI